MNRKVRTFILLVVSSICLYSCSSVRHLPPGQSMLVKNEVKVVDAKNPDFDNLKTYVRPVTNKKFMDMFRVKTVFYDWGRPTYDKNGNTKDDKFKKFLCTFCSFFSALSCVHHWKLNIFKSIGSCNQIVSLKYKSYFSITAILI